MLPIKEHAILGYNLLNVRLQNVLNAVLKSISSSRNHRKMLQGTPKWP